MAGARLYPRSTGIRSPHGEPQKAPACIDIGKEVIFQQETASAIAFPHAVMEGNRDLIIRQAIAHKMSSIFAFEAHAYASALVTYGIDRADAILRTADYVDRILRGTKPADLPVQAPANIRISCESQDGETARPRYFADDVGPCGQGE